MPRRMRRGHGRGRGTNQTPSQKPTTVTVVPTQRTSTTLSGAIERSSGAYIQHPQHAGDRFHHPQGQSHHSGDSYQRQPSRQHRASPSRWQVTNTYSQQQQQQLQPQHQQQQQQQQSQQHCTLCRSSGHNSRSCPRNPSYVARNSPAPYNVYESVQYCDIYDGQSNKLIKSYSRQPKSHIPYSGMPMPQPDREAQELAKILFRSRTSHPQ